MAPSQPAPQCLPAVAPTPRQEQTPQSSPEADGVPPHSFWTLGVSIASMQPELCPHPTAPLFGSVEPGPVEGPLLPAGIQTDTAGDTVSPDVSVVCLMFCAWHGT